MICICIYYIYSIYTYVYIYIYNSKPCIFIYTLCVYTYIYTQYIYIYVYIYTYTMYNIIQNHETSSISSHISSRWPVFRASQCHRRGRPVTPGGTWTPGVSTGNQIYIYTYIYMVFLRDFLISYFLVLNSFFVQHKTPLFWDSHLPAWMSPPRWLPVDSVL